MLCVHNEDVKRTCVPLACVSIIILLLVTGVSPIFAHHRARVLGESTQAADMVFPPVTSGPGLLLPDSPLFFLDLFKQAVRVAMALDPADRARIHALIAGERLAELRIMFTRNNESAISTDLLLLTQEMDKAAKSLSEATAAGQDTTILAKELVLSVKEARSTLNTLIGQSQGGLKLQLKAARESMKESKITLEDSLSKDELEKEMKETLEDELMDRRAQASEAAKNLSDAEKALGVPVRVPTPTPAPRSSVNY